MTIQQIKYVLALDTYRHFVRAADSCYVTQSTLTIQVKKLEDEIGCLLFDRAQQPLRPTPLGEIFIGKARQIDRAIQELKHLFNEEYRQTEGRFKLGIIPTLSPYLLPLFLREFLQEHPETYFEVEELESATMVEYLKQGQLDIGILSTPTHENDLHEIPLFTEPFVLYANPDNKILDKEEKLKVSDLDTKKIWLLREGHCFRDQMMRFCGISEHFCFIENLELEGGSVETLKRMIKSASGYTLIPELSYDEATEGAYIKRFEAPEPAREISLVVHKHFSKKQLLVDLAQSIKTHIPGKLTIHGKLQRLEWR